MDEKHPLRKDPRPKRRKDKDNPYEIFTVGIETDLPQYFIKFKDGANKEHCLEIEKELFDLLEQFELEDVSYLNEVDRHYDLSELSEKMLSSQIVQNGYSLEEMVIQKYYNARLHEAISMLPEKQRKRLVLYYFGSFTYEEIGRMEGCRYQVIQRSVEKAEEKIRKFLKNF